MASLGQALKALYTCCVIDSTMLLLCSHFTEEEIKAQRSLSNLHEIKDPTGGSSEGVSRCKSKIWKRRTAWIKHRHGKEHCKEGKGKSVGLLEWCVMRKLEGKAERRSRQELVHESVHAGETLKRVKQDTWSDLKEQELEGWEEEMRHRWAGLASACLQRASCKNAFQLLWFVLFSSKHRHDF